MQPRFITVENHHVGLDGAEHGQASMQPRFITVENETYRRYLQASGQALQCSHGSSPWRTRGGGPRYRPPIASASMQPRFITVENSIGLPLESAQFLASMQPR